MKMIGQNSPATPVPSTARPMTVGSSAASERIGTSVPSAVVASATAISHHSASRPARVEHEPNARPIASEIPQPIVPRRRTFAGTWFSITSSPAKKKSNARPKLERNEM